MDMMTGLRQCVSKVEEGSTYRGYFYRISDVLTISICGMMCGIEKAKYIWEWANEQPVREFLLDEFGIEKIPCYSQYMNILGIIDPEKFNLCFIKWVQGVLGKDIAGKTVAIDGKTICGAEKVSKDGTLLHIASAMVAEAGLVIGSREGGTRTDEITAVRELLELLDIKGTIVVADALHCHKKTAESVLLADADYLFVVKDNQPSLKDDLELFFSQPPGLLESHATVEKNGGRLECRNAYVSHAVGNIGENWANLRSIGAIRRHFEKGETITSEWHYYISSAPLTAEQLLHHARAEWQIESMHWILDVHFREDKTGIGNMNTQKTMNILRKITLNLLREFKAITGSTSALSALLRKNLFNISNLSAFLHDLSPLLSLRN
ncbi:MAG: ISAs1 family transposase [Peptococcaceae bacterium]|nr:ISAs1 family transposase [Peptococcaceae bacterium]